MKHLFLILALGFITITALGQQTVLEGLITKSMANVDIQNADVLLNDENGKTIAFVKPNTNGNYLIRLEMGGHFKLIVKMPGYRDYTKDISIPDKTILTQNFSYPAFCIFLPPKNKPWCMYGHANKTIPIIYGLPGKALMARAKKGKVKLGGCVMYECNPYYYCTIHKIEL